MRLLTVPIPVVELDGRLARWTEEGSSVALPSKGVVRYLLLELRRSQAEALAETDRLRAELAMAKARAERAERKAAAYLRGLQAHGISWDHHGAAEGSS